MKTEEKKRARALRADGLSVREIEKEVGVSRGTVSLWVRDIKLTSDQVAALCLKSGKNRLNGSQAVKEKFSKLRDKYRAEGRLLLGSLSGTKRDLFLAGCMLYWGEGSKGKNAVMLSNSDDRMLVLFLSFLTEVFGVERKDVRLQINCHDDIHSQGEIEGHWLRALGLKGSNLTKTMVNKVSRASSGKRAGLSEWGTCRLSVCRGELLQKIYGGIDRVSEGISSGG